MLIAGLLIGVFGLLLCFTIFLAPIGIILMLIGSALCIAGVLRGRKTVITNVVQVSNIPGQGMQANVPLDTEQDQRPRMRTIEPPPQQAMLSSPPLIDVTPKAAQSHAYDRAKWDALVKYDDDIGRVVKALKPYDQKYIDELATAYLTLNDKAYLPMIVQKILASAKSDSAAHGR